MSRIFQSTRFQSGPVSTIDEIAIVAKSPRPRGSTTSSLVDEFTKPFRTREKFWEVYLEQVDPWEVLTECVSAIKTDFERKGLAFIQMAGSSIPKSIRMDRLRLSQILTQMISNAVTFTHKGFVLLNIEIQTLQENPTLFIEVRDSGIGMTSDGIEQALPPLQNLSFETAAQNGGKGRGLAISQLFAYVLGATISCESVPGQGSAFRLEIPMDPSDLHFLHRPSFDSSEKKSIKSVEIMPTHPGEDRFSGKVLVVDDNPDNLTIIGYYLRRLGLLVETAPDGEEGIRKALASPFDMIFMDMQMPILDGWAATRQLRERNYSGVIVGLTAGTAAEESKGCLEAGCNLFLSKPVDALTLAKTLKTCLMVPNPPEEEPLRSDYADEEGILSLIRGYLESLDLMVKELENAVKSGDMAAAAGIAHKVKGSGGMYGYPAITQAAGAIEQCAKDESLTDISTLVNLVKRARAHPTIRSDA